MNAVVYKEKSAQTPPANDAGNVLALISRAAADPACDLDKMERLLVMHERMVSRQAQAEFADAMASMQAELPTIAERGDAAGRYTFAKWEDINAAIKPILQKHGFALTFRTDTASGVTVTGVLSHRNGHREETSITLPADASGNKNAVQAVASSVSYGKRYTAGALLNLTSHGEDDDAFGTGDYISEEQEARLRERLEGCGAHMPGFLKFLKVDALSKIRAKDYDAAVKAIVAKEKAASK